MRVKPGAWLSTSRIDTRIEIAFGLLVTVVLAACQFSAAEPTETASPPVPPTTVWETTPLAPTTSPTTTEPIPDDSFILRFDLYTTENCGPQAPSRELLAQPPTLYLVDGVFYLSEHTSLDEPTWVLQDEEMLAMAGELAEVLKTTPFTLSEPDLMTFGGDYWRLEARVGDMTSVGCAYMLQFPGLAVVSPEGAEAVQLAEALLFGLGWGGGSFWGNADGDPLEAPIVLIPIGRPELGAVGEPLPESVVIGSNRCISLDPDQQRQYLEKRAQALEERGESNRAIQWTDGEVSTIFFERRLLPLESCETLIDRVDALVEEYLEGADS